MASSLKFLVLLALVAAVVVVHADSEDSQVKASVQSSSSSNALILGKREKGDKLVGKHPVKAASKIGRKVIVKKTFDVGNKELTMVKAMDRATKNGASAELISGGVGQDSVTLRFKSQRSKGIKFEVQLFAKTGGGSGGDSLEEEEED